MLWLAASLPVAIQVIIDDCARAVTLVAADTKDAKDDVRRWMERCRWETHPLAQALSSLEPFAQALQAGCSLAKPARLTEAELAPASR